MSTQETITYDGQDKQRLDHFLYQKFGDRGLTRSFWTNMVQAGFVSVNDAPAAKPGHALAEGNSVTIEWPQIDATVADTINVLYEDTNACVLDKPAGVLSHSKGQFNPEYTVADFIQSRDGFELENTDVNNRAGIVHRLDRFTSGVMITAKNVATQTHLQKQFESRTTQKFYVALIAGANVDLPDTIEGSIRRSVSNPKTMEIHEDGKDAVTQVCGVIPLTDATAVVLKPQTGRTHQLRVHLSHLGYPILGDEIYGGTANEAAPGRFLLHAIKLTVDIPGQGEASYVSELPDDMASYLSDEDRQTITQLTEQ